MTGQLPPMWVIYDHPLDEPDHYVVRRWASPQNVGPKLLAKTVEQAREHLPAGLVLIGPQVGDDPKILEVWI